jgi:hypothetical protein
MQLKLLFVIFLVFILSMESKSAAAIVDSSDDESIGSFSSSISSIPSDKKPEHSVVSSANPEGLDCGCTGFSSTKGTTIPSLRVRHVKYHEGNLGTYTIKDVSSHEDLLQKLKHVLEQEVLHAVAYGDSGEYKGPETFQSYLRDAHTKDPDSLLVYLCTK